MPIRPSPLKVSHRHNHHHNGNDNNDDDYNDAPISPGTHAFQSPSQFPQPPRSATPSSPGTLPQNSVQEGVDIMMMGDDAQHRMSDAASDAAAAAMATAAAGGGGGGGGLGSLADELADAWEEEEEGGYGYGYASGQENNGLMVDESSPQQPHHHHHHNGSDNNGDDEHGDNDDNNDNDNDDDDDDDDYDMNGGGGGIRTPSSGYSVEHHNTLHPPRHKTRNGGADALRHRRHESQYDGSDYGNDSDLEEAADISPSLEGQMAEIESLARRGMENNGSENDHVIKRAVEALRDLGGQSGIENNAMRLITAHTSITSHLTHQTRALQTLTHPLLFSPFPLLSEDAIDALVPLIDGELLPNLPYPLPGQSRHAQHAHAHSHPSSSSATASMSSRPSTPTPSQSPSLNPLVSLQTLVSQTSDLTHSLQGLSDTLYESRQLTSTASRRLRSARELVADLRREEEGREEGSRWLERGDWDRRLKEREAGRECGDVVSGFEAVCGEWRERLFGGEVVAA